MDGIWNLLHKIEHKLNVDWSYHFDRNRSSFGSTGNKLAFLISTKKKKSTATFASSLNNIDIASSGYFYIVPISFTGHTQTNKHNVCSVHTGTFQFDQYWCDLFEASGNLRTQIACKLCPICDWYCQLSNVLSLHPLIIHPDRKYLASVILNKIRKTSWTYHQISCDTSCTHCFIFFKYLFTQTAIAPMWSRP